MDVFRVVIFFYLLKKKRVGGLAHLNVNLVSPYEFLQNAKYIKSISDDSEILIGGFTFIDTIKIKGNCLKAAKSWSLLYFQLTGED